MNGKERNRYKKLEKTDGYVQIIGYDKDTNLKNV